MSNTSLKMRIAAEANSLLAGLEEPDPTRWLSFSRHLKLAVGSLEKLTRSQRDAGSELASRLECLFWDYQEGLQANASDDLRSVQEWIASVPD
ncbi:hypothetical protein [Ramlibacter tataouinensis]|uniref:hypothetical protein n=1 Tax=Ramlibacter tataouinensis TaxID=94132 RepID=UPI00117CED49|nr:hypothetical protein [Ramlibacter tataouinensis]